LEDETGLLNIIVRPDVFEKQRKDVGGEPLVIVRGRISHEQGATRLIGEHFRPLATLTGADHVPRRDFH
jgi:error-prone DNA polymerase